MSSQSRKIYFENTIVKSIWVPVSLAVGSRWNYNNYPIVSTVKNVLENAVSDEEVCILASEALE